MHRIDHSTATVDHLFTEGNPSTGTPATVVTDDWLNDVQENIARFIENRGITLVKGDYNQLTQAIALSSYAGKFYTLNGSATWNSPTLVLTTDLEIIYRNEAGARRINKIAAGSLTINDGQVLVFRQDNTSSSPVTLTSETVYSDLDAGQYMILNESSLTLDYVADEVIVFRNRGGNLEIVTSGNYFSDGDTISFGATVPTESPTFTGTIDAEDMTMSGGLTLTGTSGITLDNSDLSIGLGNIYLTLAHSLFFNQSATTYIKESSSGTLDTYVGSSLASRYESAARYLCFGSTNIGAFANNISSGSEVQWRVSSNVANSNAYMAANNDTIAWGWLVDGSSSDDLFLKREILGVSYSTPWRVNSNGELLLPSMSTPTAGYMSRKSAVSAKAFFLVSGASSYSSSELYNVSSVSVSSYEPTLNWDADFSTDKYAVGMMNLPNSGTTAPTGFSKSASSLTFTGATTGTHYYSVIASGDQ